MITLITAWNSACMKTVVLLHAQHINEVILLLNEWKALHPSLPQCFKQHLHDITSAMSKAYQLHHDNQTIAYLCTH